MSAIQSLLRVMTLRDAEAIILETGKVPSLRRRGQIEKLAMPALEPQLLSDFATPLLADRSLDDGAVSVTFRDPDGPSYQVAIEKIAAGLRIVVRPGKPPAGPAASATPTAAVAAPADQAPRAWWAKPAKPAEPADSGKSHAGAAAAAPPASASAQRSGPPDDGLARLAQLLAPFVAVAHERAASDVILSTGLARLRVAGQLETIELVADDGELAYCVAQLGNNTDHSVEIAGTRLRVNLFDHLAGVGIAARLIRDRVPSLAELALPPELAAVVDQRDGLVLVAGPTGSGKSTRSRR